MSFFKFLLMGLFGDSNEEKEEVTLGISEEDEKSEDKGSSAEVGAVDFGSNDSSEEDSSNSLRNEVSSMDSVATSRKNSSKSSTGSSSGGSHRVTSSTAAGSNESPDLKDIRDQNQEIIDKLEKVLSRL